MRVVLYFTDNITDPQVLLFDLNFALTNYSITHTVEFPNASPELIKLLSKEPSSASSAALALESSTPRKEGKKPASSTSTLDNRPAKKKPISSSPHSKTAKKAKPESKSSPSVASKKSRKSLASTSSSSSPTPASAPLAAPQSPVYDHPSPSDYSTHSSPLPIATSTPELQTAEIETEVAQSRSSPDSSNRNIDHTYKIADVYNLSPIHHAKIDKQLRDKWDIPDVSFIFVYQKEKEKKCVYQNQPGSFSFQINMMELAKRIYRMSPDQTKEFRNLIFDNTPEGIKTVVDPG